MTTKTETKPLRERWIEALRSGEYPQAQQVLIGNPIDGDPTAAHYCCLGVLCDLAAKEAGDKEWWNLNKYHLAGDPDEELPSTEILEQVGLSDEDAQYLAGVNDDGRTFAEIAEIIEIGEFGA